MYVGRYVCLNVCMYIFVESDISSEARLLMWYLRPKRGIYAPIHLSHDILLGRFLLDLLRHVIKYIGLSCSTQTVMMRMVMMIVIMMIVVMRMVIIVVSSYHHQFYLSIYLSVYLSLSLTNHQSYSTVRCLLRLPILIRVLHLSLLSQQISTFDDNLQVNLIFSEWINNFEMILRILAPLRI